MNEKEKLVERLKQLNQYRDQLLAELFKVEGRILEAQEIQAYFERDKAEGSSTESSDADVSVETPGQDSVN